MAQWKVTYIFTGEGTDEGWSESIYLDGQNDTPAITPVVNTLAVARMGLLAKHYYIEAIRVSNASIKRRAVMRNTPPEIRKANEKVPGNGMQERGPLLQLSSLDGRTNRELLLRGFPTGWTPDAAFADVDVVPTNAMAIAALKLFQDTLTKADPNGNPALWSLKGKADQAAILRTRIQEVTRSLINDRFTVTAPGFAASVGQKVRVTGMRGEGLCGINGIHRITAKDAALPKYELSEITCDPCAISVDKLGWIELSVPAWTYIRKTSVLQFAYRKRGKRFFRSRGRRRSKGCR